MLAITSEVMVFAETRRTIFRDAIRVPTFIALGYSSRRTNAARMARCAPVQSARPGARGEGVRAPPQLCRNGKSAAEPRDDHATCGRARHATT